MNRIRNERRQVKIDTKEIQRIVRRYYKLLSANKLNSLDEMDKFLEKHNLPKLNLNESENMDEQITSSEFEAVIKKLPANKSPQLDGFAGEFYQAFKELMPIFLNLSRGGKTLKLISGGQHYCNSKTR